MSFLVRHPFTPPIFEDEHRTRTAQLLNAFLLIATGLSILGILILPFVITEMLLPFMGLFGGAVLIYLGCLIMLHRRHLRAASIVFIVTYWMVQNLAVGINGGMTSPSILNYSTVILVAGFLLGWRASIVVASLTILIGAGFVFADAARILSPPVNPVSQSIGWATLSFNLIALAVIQHWATRTLQVTADRAYHSEAALSERSRQLERESAERERTEAAYRVLVEQSLQGLFIVQDNRIVFANTELCRMIGYTAEALYALDEPGGLLHPEDRAMVLGNMARRLAGETVPSRYECRVLHKSGQELWLEIFSSRTIYLGTYSVQVAAVEITERKRAEVALRASEERYRLTSELVSDFAYCYYVNPDGTWRMDWLIGSPITLTGYDTNELSGSLRIYHPDDDERAHREVEQTLRGQSTEGDFRIITKDGHLRWIRTRRQPIWDAEENRYARFYASVQDITEQKTAGEALRQTQELRRQFLDQLKILHEVGLELTKAETFDGLCRLAVELGRSRLGFDRIGLWFVDKSDPNYIVGSFGTDEQGLLRDERHQRFSWSFNPEMEMILDGRVMITTKDDAALYDDHSHEVGQGWIAAAKLRVGDQYTGWVYIDNLLKRELRSDDQLELLALYAATISHLVIAKTTLEELHQTLEVHRQFLERLKTLHEVGLELARAESFDDLCRRAIDLGRSRLGFDRIGLWFLDSGDPEYSFGAFGTDEHGLVKDERDVRVRIGIGDDMEEILDGRVFITIRDDAPLRGSQSQVVGYGWNAVAKVRFGDKHTGWLFIDNLLKREPRSTYHLELLALYAATIGHLATAKTTLEELRQTLEQHRQFLERLKALHEVGLELSRAETLDDLSQRAIDLGRSRLGFDRIGLWFVDQSDPEYAVSSYGIDETGVAKDERGIRIKPDIGADMDEILDGRVFTSKSESAPLRFRSQVFGYGWNAVAKVWFGDKHTGWLFIDNLLKGEARSIYQLELLALYAATIGHLATAKTTLEELRYSESRLQQSIHIAQLGIWEWDNRTDAVIWSDTMFDMYGISPEEFTGKGEDYLKMTHPEDRDKQRENIRKAFERARGEISEPRFSPDPQEFRLVRADGTMRSVVGDAVAIVDQEGRPVRMLGILMDVTDRKNAEKQALELALVREREENLREFISTISHDLKTPLSVINTSLYLLERLTDPEHHKDKVQTIKAQAQLLEKYIQDILTISRLDHIPHMTHQPVSLNRSLDQIVRRLHTSIEQKNITTTLDLDDNITAVLGDENEINRALVNLIENAMNYTPPNGSIRIQTSREGNSVVAAITDTGIGIGEADLPHIFERFYRASAAQEFEERGTGLGLAIVKRIVELHHGSIDVESTVGQGTSFRIRFPLLPNSVN